MDESKIVPNRPRNRGKGGEVVKLGIVLSLYYIFDQRELLIRPIVVMSPTAYVLNYNMIGLEAFCPNILFTRIQFET